MILYQRICIFIFFLMGFSANGLTQNADDSTVFVLEAGSSFSQSKTPFWLISNKHNTVKTEPINIWLRGKIYGEYSFCKILNYNYGIDFINIYAGYNKAYIQQAYAGISHGKFLLKAGQWEQIHGNNDLVLSSGSIIWSGNARPIPMILFNIEKYINVPFTNSFIQFKGGISHGWIPDNEVIKNAFLHHKNLYVRIGGAHDIHLEYGLHHFAQWGGISINPEFGSITKDFATFVKVFFGQGGGTGSITNESINALGNHVGSHNLSLNIEGTVLTKYIYWQNIFEDRSGMRLKNYKDGLVGIRISINDNRKFLKTVLFEFLNTTHQSGRFSTHLIDSTYHDGTGNDNYFNHSLYGGWTVGKMTIGTPLITSPILLTDESGIRIINNKVTAYHFGFSGSVGSTDYKALYTFSENYATNSQPFASVKNQHSFLVQSTFNKLLPYDIKATISIGIDKGELLGNRAGVYFCLKKEGFLTKSK